MSFQFNGIQAQVQISGSVSTTSTIPSMPTGATIKNISFGRTINQNTTTTLYTPTAGKTFYITGIWASSLSAVPQGFRLGDNFGAGNFWTAATDYDGQIVLGTNGNANDGLAAFQTVISPPLPIVTALKINLYNNGSFFMTITGYEV